MTKVYYLIVSISIQIYTYIENVIWTIVIVFIILL